MRRVVLFTCLVAFAAAAIPTAAPAKGASKAVITGPCLGGPIQLGPGEPGQQPAPSSMLRPPRSYQTLQVFAPGPEAQHGPQSEF